MEGRVWFSAAFSSPRSAPCRRVVAGLDARDGDRTASDRCGRSHAIRPVKRRGRCRPVRRRSPPNPPVPCAGWSGVADGAVGAVPEGRGNPVRIRSLRRCIPYCGGTR